MGAGPCPAPHPHPASLCQGWRIHRDSTPARAWGGGSGVQETQGQMVLKGPGGVGQKAWDGESQQGLVRTGDSQVPPVLPGWGGNSRRRGATLSQWQWVEARLGRELPDPSLACWPTAQARQVREPQPCGCDLRCTRVGVARPPALPLSVAFHQLRTLTHVFLVLLPFFAGGTGEGTTEQSDVLPSSLDGRSGSKGAVGGEQV